MTIKLLGKLDFSISKEDLEYIRAETNLFLKSLKAAIKSAKVRAEPFVGGSFAKGTMIQSESYDTDIFVRFDKKYDEKELPKLLEKIMNRIKLKHSLLHGSRDYFQIEGSKRLTFEIIPVIKINKQKEGKNTTDLSYFHVNYVKKRLNSKLVKEIGLTKKFFKAQKVYGAESYISGFSGYAIECLVIYYKSFEKMIREFANAESKIVIDGERYYGKQNVMLELNESKRLSPIVLIDPTWKERNVLAALSQETFDKLRGAISKFIKHPSASYFEVKDIDENELKQTAKRQGAEYIKIELTTNKQAGDIAGTKLKKFSKFLVNELSNYFDVKREEFEYKLGKDANLYLILKSKKEIIEQGPPLKMGEHAAAFRKAHKNIFLKGGRLFAKIKINFSGKDFVKRFASQSKKKLIEMNITSLKVD